LEDALIERGVSVQEPTETTESVDPRLVGIRGWLLLAAIVLAASGANLVLVMLFLLYLSSIALLYFLEFLVFLALVAFTVYANALFYQKKRSAPSTIISWYSAVLVSGGVCLVIELYSGAKEFIGGTLLVRGIVPAVIWVPYFLLSKRVKATFVN
jgi:hypothetical protein